jgi:uncharacterized delta-60 repeat protein
VKPLLIATACASVAVAYVGVAAAGQLDTLFGGDGLVVTSFGAPPQGVTGLVRRADGRLVAAGFSNAGGALAGYKTDGSLDASFGTGGIVTDPIGAGWGDLLVTRDGALVSAGAIFGEGRDYAVARHAADGSLDTAFGANGVATNSSGASDDVAYAVGEQSDAKLVIAGDTTIPFGPFAGSSFVLARFTSVGAVDTPAGAE